MPRNDIHFPGKTTGGKILADGLRSSRFAPGSEIDKYKFKTIQ